MGSAQAKEKEIELNYSYNFINYGYNFINYSHNIFLLIVIYFTIIHISSSQ